MCIELQDGQVRCSGAISSLEDPNNIPQSICLSWHGQILNGIVIRNFHNAELCTLSSSNRDANIVHRLARLLGNMNVIRVSKDPKKTMRKMMDQIEEGITLYINPDGSRGPAMRLKNTLIIRLAKKYGLPIVTTSAATKRMITKIDGIK